VKGFKVRITAFYMGRGLSPPVGGPWGRWRTEAPHGPPMLILLLS